MGITRWIRGDPIVLGPLGSFVPSFFNGMMIRLHLDNNVSPLIINPKIFIPSTAINSYCRYIETEFVLIGLKKEVFKFIIISLARTGSGRNNRNSVIPTAQRNSRIRSN